MTKVVIIEDDAVIAKIYEAKLRADGKHVVVAETGKIGIELVKRMNPQLILVDLMLPDMSGIEVIRTLRGDVNFADVPIIAYAGADDAMLAEARQANSTRVLSKNEMSPKEIFENVCELLEASQGWQTSVPDFGEVRFDSFAKQPLRADEPQARVLLVEDDSLIARVVKDIIERAGYEAVAVDDGGEALRVLTKDADFVAGVFDVDLPKISGNDLLCHMRTEKRLMKIPVMIMTANESLCVQLAA